jgi:hypothetical protein
VASSCSDLTKSDYDSSVDADVDKGERIDGGLEGPQDCCMKWIVEEWAKIFRLLDLLPCERWASSEEEEFGGLE